MSGHYATLTYNSKNRWVSYWYQVQEVASASPESLLVIGKGNGIVEHALATIAPGIKVTTFDRDEGLSPDVVGDIRNLPFDAGSFDCILCCQVLEHLPFQDLPGVLRELERVVRDRVVLSVPQGRKFIKVEFAASKIGTKRLIIKNPFCKRDIRSKHHCWEINKGVTYREFLDLVGAYFAVEKNFLNEIGCYHRFFVLKKRASRR